MSAQNELVPGTNFYPFDSKPESLGKLVPGTNFGTRSGGAGA
jgi:hypothetical protein